MEKRLHGFLDTPRSVRRPLFVLFLIPLLAVGHALVLFRLPLWKINPILLGSIFVPTLLAVLLIRRLILRGYGEGFNILSLLATSWSCYAIGLTWKKGNPNLAFFSIFLIVFWIPYLTLLKRRINQKCFYSPLHWFSGLPRPIPILEGEALLGEQRYPIRFSTLDHSGGFIFNPEAHLFEDALLELSRSRPPLYIPFELSFRDRHVRTQGRVTFIDRFRRGATIEFQPTTRDEAKELSDLVEFAQGEGYV